MKTTAALLIGLLIGAGSQIPELSDVRDGVILEPIHDADTFKIVWLPATTVRLHGADACEVNRVRRTVTITDEELAKGRESRDALQKIVDAAGGHVRVRVTDANAVYGRTEADVWIGDVDVAAWVKANGYER